MSFSGSQSGRPLPVAEATLLDPDSCAATVALAMRTPALQHVEPPLVEEGAPRASGHAVLGVPSPSRAVRSAAPSLLLTPDGAPAAGDEADRLQLIHGWLDAPPAMDNPQVLRP